MGKKKVDCGCRKRVKSRFSFVLFFKMGERTTCLFIVWNDPLGYKILKM